MTQTTCNRVGEHHTPHRRLFLNMIHIAWNFRLAFYCFLDLLPQFPIHAHSQKSHRSKPRKWSDLCELCCPLTNMFELFFFFSTFFRICKISHDNKQHKTSDINRARVLFSLHSIWMLRWKVQEDFSFQFQINCRMVMCPKTAEKQLFLSHR